MQISRRFTTLFGDPGLRRSALVHFVVAQFSFIRATAMETYIISQSFQQKVIKSPSHPSSFLGPPRLTSYHNSHLEFFVLQWMNQLRSVELQSLRDWTLKPSNSVKYNFPTPHLKSARHHPPKSDDVKLRHGIPATVKTEFEIACQGRCQCPNQRYTTS